MIDVLYIYLRTCHLSDVVCHSAAVASHLS